MRDLHSFPTRRSSDLLLTGKDVKARNPGVFMDEISARAIVRPRTTQEVSRILKLCNDAGQPVVVHGRSEEHSSELQSRPHLVCRLLLQKQNGLVAIGS